jgi:cephalosporin hydroxylase
VLRASNPEQEVIRRFHALYYNAAGVGGTWAQTYWMGVPVLKCPLDLWVYQEILREVQPELIIECGTAAGGSALFYAHLCDLIGKGEVVSIDIHGDTRRPQHPRITYWTGSSTDRSIVDRAWQEARRRSPVLVILDSDHSAEHVLQELRLYSPLVTPGSYLIIEDTNINGHPTFRSHGPGPMEAVQAFLLEDSSFFIDPTREKFYLTFNPCGYLRKRVPGSTHPDPASSKAGARLRGAGRNGWEGRQSWRRRARVGAHRLIGLGIWTLALAALDRARARAARKS